MCSVYRATVEPLAPLARRGGESGGLPVEEQIQRLVARPLPAQAVEAGVGDQLAGGEDFGDGGAAVLGAGDADRGLAMGAALVPASGRRGLGRVGAEVNRGGHLRALRRPARIAEVFLAVNPHLGALLRVGARDSRQGLRQSWEWAPLAGKCDAHPERSRRMGQAMQRRPLLARALLRLRSG